MVIFNSKNRSRLLPEDMDGQANLPGFAARIGMDGTSEYQQPSDLGNDGKTRGNKHENICWIGWIAMCCKINYIYIIYNYI